jgi:hypothetical protein
MVPGPQRVASAVRKFLESKNISFQPLTLPRIHTLAVQHRQHKKRSLLIPEFSDIHWLHANTVIHDSQKVIPSSLRGEYQEGDPMERSNDDILVGTWRTPEQFVSKAQSVTHPMDECALEEITKDVIRFVSKSDPRLVSVERRKNLLKARIMAKQLEEQEMDLHRNLPELVEKVVGGKRIFLWKRLLEQNGYDMEVVKFMTEGVPLVGSHDHPSCYPLKLKAASMPEEELRDSALSCPGKKEASNRSPGLCRTSRGDSRRRGETAISRRAFLLFSRSE